MILYRKGYYEINKKNNFSLKKRIKRKFKKYRDVFYAQNGEDLIIYNLLNRYKSINKIKYLDIGCGDPKFLSNTYYLYKKGASGWCYDADSNFAKKFKKSRPKDKFFCYFINTKEEEKQTDFFKIEMPELNTSSEQIVDYLKSVGFKVKRKEQIPCKNIIDILKEIYTKNEIDFLSIDIEGQDFDILKAIDLAKYRPKIICVEAVDFETGNNSILTNQIVTYMKKNNYEINANTNVNLIFIANEFKKYIFDEE